MLWNSHYSIDLGTLIPKNTVIYFANENLSMFIKIQTRLRARLRGINPPAIEPLRTPPFTALFCFRRVSEPFGVSFAGLWSGISEIGDRGSADKCCKTSHNRWIRCNEVPRESLLLFDTQPRFGLPSAAAALLLFDPQPPSDTKSKWGRFSSQFNSIQFVCLLGGFLFCLSEYVWASAVEWILPWPLTD